MKFKRALFSFHRWTGAGLCGLFVIWFASGIVMTIPGYPTLRESERLAHAEGLVVGDGRGASPTGEVSSLRLAMMAGRPTLRGSNADGAWVMDFASGIRRNSVPEAILPEVATRFSNQPAKPIGTVDDADQWTLSSRVRLRAPHVRYSLNDEADTEIYVSARTGEVVQVTTARTRAMAWLGAIPHWLYLPVLRRNGEAWRLAIIWLSGIGTLTTLAGLALGIWNARWRRPGLTPYQKTWPRWHHQLGLGFGVLVFTWVGSGALSLNPFRWSPGSNPDQAEQLAFAGGPLVPSRFVLPIETALARCNQQIAVKEVDFIQVAAIPFFVCKESPSVRRVVRADQLDAPAIAEIPKSIMESALARVAPELAGTLQKLSIYDAYHRHSRQEDPPPLPVLLARAQDETGVWWYLDPASGTIVRRLGSAARVERWLYNGLHSLDFRWLYEREWLWRIVITTLCLVGLSLSVTGTGLAVHWTRRRWRRR